MIDNKKAIRTRIVTTRFTDNEWYVLADKAGAKGKGVSTYIRELVNADLKDKPASIPILHNEEFLEQFCLSIAIQIMTGSNQLTEEQDIPLIALTDKIRTYLRKST